MNDETPKVVGRLNAREIKFFDTINEDTAGNEQTLRVAMNFHANVSIELIKRHKEMWAMISERLGIDIKTSPYTIKVIDGEVAVIEGAHPDRPRRIIEI